VDPDKYKQALANNPRLKRLAQEVATGRQRIVDMQKDITQHLKDIQRDQSREEIRFWMDNAIIPFLEGVAEEFDEPLLNGIERLIKEHKNPLATRKAEAETALRNFFSAPQTKVLYTIARPYVRVKTDFILKEAEWIREAIMKEEYPDLYDVITKTQGGVEWLDDLIKAFVQIIRKI